MDRERRPGTGKHWSLDDRPSTPGTLQDGFQPVRKGRRHWRLDFIRLALLFNWWTHSDRTFSSSWRMERLCQNSELVGQYFWYVNVTCTMLKIKEYKKLQHRFLMKIFMIIVVKWYKSVTKLSLFKNCIHLVANAENNLELECISYVCTAPYLGSMSCQLSAPIIRSSLLAFFSTKKRTVADKSLV